MLKVRIKHAEDLRKQREVRAAQSRGAAAQLEWGERCARKAGRSGPSVYAAGPYTGSGIGTRTTRRICEGGALFPRSPREVFTVLSGAFRVFDGVCRAPRLHRSAEVDQERVAKEQAYEMAKKKDLIRQIRALERVSVVRPQPFDPSEPPRHGVRGRGSWPSATEVEDAGSWGFPGQM